ncbi:MAG: hypothetical protein AAFX85_02525, partial [Pseudomonadota bacterium]
LTLSNHPGYPGCNWAVWVWPVRHREVAPGATLSATLQRPDAVRDAMEWSLDCRIAVASD